MKNLARFNPYLVVIHLFCLLLLCYTYVIITIFASTDSLNTHLKQSGLYADISTIVKTRLSETLEQRMQDRIVLRAISEKLLDAVITPEFVEKRSQRLLPVAEKILSQPLAIENNNVVVDTKTYKQQVTAEIDKRQIPEIVVPVIQNLITTVPDTLILVDMENRPNSVLGFLTKAKMFYEHTTLWNSIAWTVGIITALILIIINRENLRTLFKYLAMAYLISGIVVFIGSYVLPYIIMLFNTGPNLNLNTLVNDAIYYLFAQTRLPSIILLVLGGLFYFLFRWSYIDALQFQVNKMLRASSETKAQAKKKNK